MIGREELLNFIKKVKESGEFEGCWFRRLDEYGNHLVFSNQDYDGDGYKLVCKIAYNVDNLQCDYNIDWGVEGYFDTEISDCDEYDTNEQLASAIEEIYEQYVEYLEEHGKRIW